jgi:hypothetical protein
MDSLMDNAWFLLYTTDKYYEAEILKGLLEDNQIPVVVVNKQDSSYVFLGDIEIYVPAYLRDLSKDLLNGAINN